MTFEARQAPLRLSPRFEVRQKLGEGAMGVVYEVLDLDTRGVLAAKTLQAMSADRLYALKSEFRRLADLTHRNLIRFGELFYDGRDCFFTMELVRGVNLQQHVRVGDQTPEVDQDTELGPPLGVEQVPHRHAERAREDGLAASLPPRSEGGFDEGRLRDAFAQLAAGIHTLHRHGLLHRDLKPSNVLVDMQGRVVVLDFGIAAELHATSSDNDQLLSGTPAFMAPEQVLLEPLGPSADWYAFGVMLFYALTGRLPFVGSTYEVLLAKREQTAPAPCDLVECPADLNALCTALLASAPADRPSGEQVLVAFARGAAPRAHSDAAFDAGALFVGRAAELARLHAAIDEVATGHQVALLVEGEPGLGKTELVEHFLAQLAADGRSLTLLHGRCYEQEFVAFKGLDAAIDGLSRYLKGLDQELVARLLPSRVSLVAALFPVLYRVPAIAATIPAANVNETKPEQRDEALAQLAQLLSSVAGDTRLVLFIDDLQWAGDDTLRALATLSSGALRPSMLMLATSRHRELPNRELGGSSPVSSLQPSLPREGMARAARADFPEAFERISLLPLSETEASELTAQIFALSEGQAIAPALLARLLSEASGHPLLLRELARYLQRGAELPHDLRLEDVLRERIHALPPLNRKLLEVIAVAGVPLPERVVARVAGVEPAAYVQTVRELRAAQLIRTSSAAVRHQTLEVYHDRVREAVGQGIALGRYQLLVAADLASIHLALARQLVSARNKEQLAVSAAMLANQYNLAAPVLRDDADAREAVAANLEAARAAKLSAAYDNALNHIEAARAHTAHLSDHAFRAAQRRTIDLRDLSLALLRDDRGRVDTTFSRLLSEGRGDTELAETYEARIQGETAMTRHAEAIASAREGLRKLSFSLPTWGSKLMVLVHVLRLELALRGHTPDSILALPLATNERTRAQSVLLMAAGPAAFLSDTALMSLLALSVALLTLRRGVTEFSAYGFASYALVLGGAFHRYKRAYEFGLLAKRLNERLQNRSLDCKLEFLFTMFCLPYVEPLDAAWPGMQRAEVLGLANGDLAFRTYAASTLAIFGMVAGKPVREQVAICEHGLHIAQQEGNGDIMAMAQQRMRALRCLDGSNPDVLSLDAADSTEEEFWRPLGQRAMPTACFTRYLSKAMLGCHFDDAGLTLRAAVAAEPYMAGEFNMPNLIELAAYVVLAAARERERSVRWLDKLRLHWLAARNLQFLSRVARTSERNYGCYYRVARGEHRRVLGRRDDARADLDAALALATRYQVHNVAGLAFERLARWHQRFGSADDRRRALEGAADSYRRWGAHACVERIQRLSQGSAT